MAAWPAMGTPTEPDSLPGVLGQDLQWVRAVERDTLAQGCFFRWFVAAQQEYAKNKRFF